MATGPHGVTVHREQLRLRDLCSRSGALHVRAVSRCVSVTFPGDCPRGKGCRTFVETRFVFACSRRCVRQRAQSGVLDSEVEVKKFYTYRALSAVAAIVALVVESGAGHKFA